MSTFYAANVYAKFVLTYAAPAFFNALSKYLKDELVRVEKQAMSTNMPRTSLPGSCQTGEHCPHCRFHHRAT